MATRSVVLINESRAPLTRGRLKEVAHALQVQVVRDFEPIWGETARVCAADASEAPGDSWPIRIVDGAAQLGVHLDDHGRPYAQVQATNDWTVTASHELLEMLVDPEGDRVSPGHDIDPDHHDREVQYVVEVCDPCQVYDYPIGPVSVSDFVTREYYEPASTGPARFDFLGRLGAPLEVPRGCCLSWFDPRDRRWHQREADGRFSRDAPSVDAGNHRDDRDGAIAAATRDDRHDLLAATRAMFRELAEAALHDLFSNDDGMRQIIERTASKHQWDEETVREAVQEYRRHLLLRYLHPNLPVSALDERADRLFHTHILNTHKYRVDCELIFGGPVEHESTYPASDVPPAQDPVIQRTVRLYRHEFNQAPPSMMGRTCDMPV